MGRRAPSFYFILLLLLFVFLSSNNSEAKSVIEPCNAADSCTSLLSYRLPWDSQLSEIAFRFQLQLSDLLASNSISFDSARSNPILPAKSLVKIPILCPCVEGIRRSVSTTYSVRAADDLDSIARAYGGLVSAEQIRSVNGLDGAQSQAVLTGVRSLVIPLPCTCFNNANNGAAAVFMSYVVQTGESLGTIGARYGTTVSALEAVNGLVQPQVDPGDILAIPLPACSSANLKWYNDSLIVPAGSSALTAYNCIKCCCESSNLILHCSPSDMVAASCSHLQCKDSDMFIGDVHKVKTESGCNFTACVYRGHSGHKIHRSLVNSSQLKCSVAGLPSSSATFPPIIPLPPSSPPPPPPSPPPFSASSQLNASNPTSKQSEEDDSRCDRMLPFQASLFGLLFLEFAFSFFF